MASRLRWPPERGRGNREIEKADAIEDEIGGKIGLVVVVQVRERARSHVGLEHRRRRSGSSPLGEFVAAGARTRHTPLRTVTPLHRRCCPRQNAAASTYPTRWARSGRDARDRAPRLMPSKSVLAPKPGEVVCGQQDGHEEVNVGCPSPHRDPPRRPRPADVLLALGMSFVATSGMFAAVEKAMTNDQSHTNTSYGTKWIPVKEIAKPATEQQPAKPK